MRSLRDALWLVIVSIGEQRYFSSSSKLSGSGVVSLGDAHSSGNGRHSLGGFRIDFGWRGGDFEEGRLGGGSEEPMRLSWIMSFDHATDNARSLVAVEGGVGREDMVVRQGQNWTLKENNNPCALGLVWQRHLDASRRVN